MALTRYVCCWDWREREGKVSLFMVKFSVLLLPSVSRFFLHDASYGMMVWCCLCNWGLLCKTTYLESELQHARPHLLERQRGDAVPLKVVQQFHVQQVDVATLGCGKGTPNLVCWRRSRGRRQRRGQPPRVPVGRGWSEADACLLALDAVPARIALVTLLLYVSTSGTKHQPLPFLVGFSIDTPLRVS